LRAFLRFTLKSKGRFKYNNMGLQLRISTILRARLPEPKRVPLSPAHGLATIKEKGGVYGDFGTMPILPQKAVGEKQGM